MHDKVSTNKWKTAEGFSLINVMAVLAIISVLIGVVAPIRNPWYKFFHKGTYLGLFIGSRNSPFRLGS